MQWKHCPTLPCGYVVEEVHPTTTFYPPRRQYTVQLRLPPPTVDGEAVLALSELPANGDRHPNPSFRVCTRGAVKTGPARWDVFIHYQEV